MWCLFCTQRSITRISLTKCISQTIFIRKWRYLTLNAFWIFDVNSFQLRFNVLPKVMYKSGSDINIQHLKGKSHHNDVSSIIWRLTVLCLLYHFVFRQPLNWLSLLSFVWCKRLMLWCTEMFYKSAVAYTQWFNYINGIL